VSRHDFRPPWHLDGATWWACDHPERPGDHLAVYNEACGLCLLKLRADVRRDPEIREAIREHLAEEAPHHDCLVPPDILALDP
jgi:hypothetical protein